ncbi:signal recognition particle 19 kDa protein-like [Mytilus galloprovincialis]|uniref:signal recognition particle 19 kDa protein-like n=1 Tax=Mytilus galloprovincialis TaxID=29158 RepID=UPI003F7B7963
MAQTQPAQARPWNPSAGFKHTDRERWICVYPAYINSKKSLKEGRRLQKQICVENPTCQEIKDVLIQSGLHIGIENNVYPRELDHRDPKCRGRVRVMLKTEDGEPFSEKFPDRDSVLTFIAETIPKLKTRIAGNQSSQQPAQTQQASKGGQKKKGRKGK